jgi:hypothetical protein
MNATSKQTNWTPTSKQRPEIGRRIKWMDSDGQTFCGKFLGGAIWMLDTGMYVYYIPKFWRYL